MKWLKYGLALLAIGAAVAAWILFREKVPIPSFKKEKEAIDAEMKIKKMAINLSEQAALHHVEREYEETIKKLEEDEKKQAEDLRKSPEKLAAFLVRAAK